MLRTSKRLAAGLVVDVVLLAGTGKAADPTTTTTVTTTTTTTTTTLLPHPYSDATRTCVRAARAAKRACTASTCVANFQKEFAKCFSDPTGAKPPTRKCMFGGLASSIRRRP